MFVMSVHSHICKCICNVYVPYSANEANMGISECYVCNVSVLLYYSPCGTKLTPRRPSGSK